MVHLTIYEEKKLLFGTRIIKTKNLVIIFKKINNRSFSINNKL